MAQAVAAEPGPRPLAEVAGAAGNPLPITELLAVLAQERAIAGRRRRGTVCGGIDP